VQNVYYYIWVIVLIISAICVIITSIARGQERREAKRSYKKAQENYYLQDIANIPQVQSDIRIARERAGTLTRIISGDLSDSYCPYCKGSGTCNVCDETGKYVMPVISQFK
jgi:hypothetical protein